MKKILLTILVVVGGIIIISENVSADAWWGEGYRSPEWVRAHGGTTITYTIVGGSSKRYKGVMFQNGKYVEVEFGNNAVFDDAKNGVYTVSFYKCKDSCMPHKTDNKTKIRSSDKKVATVSVIARPGEDVRLVFNASNNSVTFTSGTAGRPIDPFLAKKNLAKRHAGQKCEIFNTEEKKEIFMQAALKQDSVNIKDINKYIKLGLLPESFQEEIEEVIVE
ncbi:MAG: hypothetical protein KAT04_05325 [Methylococcales bacterium]|nr:hypothetical protein [Candidatus Moranbacteria bacterium]MCK4841288.1 hypothetical protein [Methylococcales bacterium]